MRKDLCVQNVVDARLSHQMVNRSHVNIVHATRNSLRSPALQMKRISSLPWPLHVDMAGRSMSRSFIVKVVVVNSFCRPTKFHPLVYIAVHHMWSTGNLRSSYWPPMELSRMRSISNARSNIWSTG